MSEDTLGTAKVKVVADTSQLRPGLQKAKGEVGKAVSDINADTKENLFKGVSDSAALKFAIIGTAISASIVKVVKLASAVEESENLFNVSFGNMAKSVREWSEQISASLNLNANEIRRQVGTFGTMIEAMGLGETASIEMSKGLVKLAYDLASFQNLTPEEAFDKLRAGISGETEPLKRLGYVLSEVNLQAFAVKTGIAKVGQEMTEQQKVVARYGYLLSITGDAQGDLARTAGSNTNQWRILGVQLKAVGESLGQVLLPASTAVATVLNIGVGVVRSFTAEHQTLLKVIVGGTAALAGWVAIVAGAPRVVMALNTSLSLLRTTALTTWAAITGPVALVIAALVAIGAAIYTLRAVWNKNLYGIQETFGNFVNDIADMGALIGVNFRSMLDGIVSAFKWTFNAIIGGWMGMYKLLSTSLSTLDPSKALDDAMSAVDHNWWGDFVNGSEMAGENAAKAIKWSGDRMAEVGGAVSEQWAKDIDSIGSMIKKKFPEFEGYMSFDPDKLLEGVDTSNPGKGGKKAKEDTGLGGSSKYWKGYNKELENLNKNFMESAKLQSKLADQVFGSMSKSFDEFNRMLDDSRNSATDMRLSVMPDEAIGNELERILGLASSFPQILTPEVITLLSGETFEQFGQRGVENIDKVLSRMQLLPGVTSESMEAVRKGVEKSKLGTTFGKVADVMDGLGQAASQLGPKFQRVSQVMHFAATAMRNYSMIMKGGLDAVLAVIQIIIEALGFLGDKSKKEAEGIDKFYKDLGEAVEQQMAQLADLIADTILEGKADFESFFKGVSKQFLSLLINDVFLNPIIKWGKNAIFGAKGMAVGDGGGKIAKFGKGGIPDGPRAFPMSGGNIGIMNETMRRESILPLERDSQGDLGVKLAGALPPMGGGGDVNVEVYNNTNARVTVAREIGSDGIRKLKMYLTSAMSEAVADGSFDPALRMALSRTGLI